MKQPNLDSGSTRSDTSRLETLPDFPISLVAGMAGVADEAMRRYLEEANVSARNGMVSIENLLRGTFTLLGRKENQSILLRDQLSIALQREKELTETLRSGLLGLTVQVPRNEIGEAATPVAASGPARKNTPVKKKKKK